MKNISILRNLSYFLIIIIIMIIKCSIQNLINRSSGMPTRHARNGYFNQKWMPVYTPKVG